MMMMMSWRKTRPRVYSSSKPNALKLVTQKSSLINANYAMSSPGLSPKFQIRDHLLTCQPKPPRWSDPSSLPSTQIMTHTPQNPRSFPNLTLNPQPQTPITHQIVHNNLKRKISKPSIPTPPTCSLKSPLLGNPQQYLQIQNLSNPTTDQHLPNTYSIGTLSLSLSPIAREEGTTRLNSSVPQLWSCAQGDGDRQPNSLEKLGQKLCKNFGRAQEVMIVRQMNTT